METKTQEYTGYEGYIWYSNCENPQLIESKDTVVLTENDLPFIVEGYLANGNKSIKIKNYDGQYFCYEYLLNAKNDKLRLLKEHVYPTHEKLFGNKRVVFAELQELQTYDGFAEWITVTKIFKGFTPKN